MIACKVTVTNADTGYNLYDLVAASYASVNFNADKQMLGARITSITIQYLGTGNAWVVPYNGAYTPSGGEPPQFGYSFSAGGALWDKNATVNNLSLKEIFLASDTPSDTFAVLAFTA